jgi:uncharacterized membrane protein YfcA
MELDLAFAALLVVTGVIAGIINTLAGGGTNLTLPALMVMGMPADIANATNRVAVLLQNLTALWGFKRAGKVPEQDVGPVLVPTLIGGLCGAAAAAYTSIDLLKPLLLGSMLTMTVIMLVKPSVVIPPPGTAVRHVRDTPSAWFWLWLAGFYGGFVQAGVGFILITALAGSLRYDLVRTNALKVVCVSAFTALALAVFIYQDLVLWVPGLTLAAGSMLGAHLAVKFAINASATTLKWFLFVMTLAGTIAALWFD